MKKLIILIALAFTTLGYSQAEFEKIALTENGVSTSTNKINTQEANGEVNYIDAVNLPTPTATTNALDLKTTLSAGAFSGFAVTNNGDGTISVGSGIAYLRAANDQYAPLVKYPIAAYNNIPLVDNLNNYIVVSYNGGSPALVLNTTGIGIDTQTTSIAIAAARIGTTVHYVSLVGSNSDPNAKLRNRYLQSEGIRRVAGLAISATGRKIATTAGITYSGLIRLDVAAMNTNTSDTYTLAYNNGSTWTRVTGQTDINNTQYNNAGTLTALSNNNFRTDYIYALVNSPSKLFVILGNTQYNTIGAARLAPTPSSLPVELEQLGVLVGRSIIEKDAVTMEMASPFVQDFAAGAIENHNDLAGLQGGTAGEYNHLTDAQVALVDGSEQTSNKQNSLAPDGTGVKFPTVDAVNNGLKLGFSDAEIIGRSFDGYKEVDDPETSANSEPHIIRMANNNIIMVYRKSTTFTHVGNDGYLVGKISADEGVTWGTEFSIFNDSYDDRNHIVAKMPNNDIVVVFRRFDATISDNIDMGYVRSTNNGATWGSYNIIESSATITTCVPFGNIVTRGSDIYFPVQVTDAGVNTFRFYKSTNNMTSTTFTDMVGTITNNAVEPFVIDIAGGKSIMLARNNDETTAGQPSFYQYNSADGVNFTYKGITNLWIDKNKSVATPVSMYWDSINDDLVVTTTERTYPHVNRPEQAYNMLRVYTQKAEDVYASQTDYELKHNVPRPKASDYRFYGYPSTLLSGSGLLVALSDASSNIRDLLSEDVDIYTFRLDNETTLRQLINRPIPDSKVAINNGYNGLKDYLDYNTVSRVSRFDDIVKTIADQKITANTVVNYLPRLTGVNTYGNSQISDDGTDVHIGAVSTQSSGTTAGVYMQRKTTGSTDLSIVGNAVTGAGSVLGKILFRDSSLQAIAGGLFALRGSTANFGSFRFDTRGSGGYNTGVLTLTEAGTALAATAPAGTNTTQIATTAFVQTAITNNGTITTATNITNATLTDTSLPQNGKTLYVSNGANNINYTVNGSITASFVKGGTGSITFVQGSGRTMVAANGTLVFNGAQYSTASIVSFGTTDIVYINNF